MNATLTELAWCAGVVDGCGRFYWWRSGPYPRVELRVFAAPDILRRVREKTDAKGRLVASALALSGDELEAFLLTLLPYLVTHREDGLKVLQFHATGSKRRVGWHLSPAVLDYRNRLVERGQRREADGARDTRTETLRTEEGDGDQRSLDTAGRTGDRPDGPG